MLASNSWTPILKAVDLLIAEINHLRAAGLHFRITYRFGTPQTIGRVPGQEIFAIFLVHRGREYQLRLTLAQRLVFDFLANYCRVAQSARQIEFGIRTNEFYSAHAMNATGREGFTRKIPRSSITEHIRRIHTALGIVFREAGLGIDPHSVLIVQDTVGNEALYKLKATITHTFFKLSSPEHQPLP